MLMKEHVNEFTVCSTRYKSCKASTFIPQSHAFFFFFVMKPLLLFFLLAPKFSNVKSLYIFNAVQYLLICFNVFDFVWLLLDFLYGYLMKLFWGFFSLKSMYVAAKD